MSLFSLPTSLCILFTSLQAFFFLSGNDTRNELSVSLLCSSAHFLSTRFSSLRTEVNYLCVPLASDRPRPPTPLTPNPTVPQCPLQAQAKWLIDMRKVMRRVEAV